MYNQPTLQAQVHFSAQKPIAAQRRGGALAQIPETKGEFMIRRLSTSLLRIVALLSVVNTVCQAQSQSSLTRHVRQVTRNGQARPLGRLSQIETIRLVSAAAGPDRPRELSQG